ncbi:Multicopper oxidase [Geoalkalibacter ferrihydriticus]|uniref:Multicopper oxidase n=1 Tax=Geoalkalibacter ferrihydriticus TaxID=392333 RepID=A0A1G9MXR0_9BACT|nr:multicopper oxidase domain-containing protein [Geoalkalibacter ferrihydriticus]SDL78405.1 Multicopper oxidase [Geoalkalibacter ferrihydriticus]
MKRREFIKFSATGLSVVALGTMAEWPMFWRGSQAHASSFGLDRLNLEMVAVDAEMVDGIPVPMWAFKIAGDDHENEGMEHDLTAPRIPGPAMIALAGDRIRLRILNHIDDGNGNPMGGAHSFAIPGVTLTVDGEDVQQVTIPYGESVDIEFTAPQAGTYMYLDPLNAPVNRMMGLHGVLVVMPNPVGNNTPYLNPTSNIQALFDDLGTTAHFPGAPWDPVRNVIWVFNVIDSSRFALAAGSPNGVDPGQFQYTPTSGYLPDYFTLNGKSGFFSAQHHHHSEGVDTDHDNGGDGILSLTGGVHDLQSNISFRGAVGQPLLIRSLNAGNMWHSPHIHGTHVYSLAQANFLTGQRGLLNNLTMLDTWALPPGAIVDLLHPYNVPPDVPEWPLEDELFPLVYPMHDHNEITNTAAGGNYPQGIATHWQIDEDFDPSNPATGVIFVDRAELRVKTGQLLIEGRFSVPSQSDSDPIFLHAHGGGHDAPILTGRIRVGTDGRFSFRGRALKAMGSRFVTLMHHGEGHSIHAARSVPLRLR